MNRAIRKYRWDLLKPGRSGIYKAVSPRAKFLLRAVLLRSAAYYRARWDKSFRIKTHEVSRGIEVTRVG